MDGIELKNINFLALASGERPILVIKFKFCQQQQRGARSAPAWQWMSSWRRAVHSTYVGAGD